MGLTASVRKLPGTQIEIRIKDFFKKSICITSIHGFAKYLGKFILQAREMQIKSDKTDGKDNVWQKD